MTWGIGQDAGPAALPGAVMAKRWLAPTNVAIAAVFGLTLLGCTVRILAARGELWIDEIWSLALVAGLTSPDQVFWAVSHDNNHFLNSLWLYVAGPDRAPLVYRVPAIACGTLSILVAARLGSRRGPAAGIVAAGLVAFGYPFVDYGSEARGYAGLILAILLALAAFESAVTTSLAQPSSLPKPSNRHRWWLGCSIAFGTLSHFTMLAAAAVFALAAALRFRMAGRSLTATAEETVALFGPTLLLLGPIAVAVVAGAVVKGGFTVGGTVPFSWTGILDGFGSLLRLSAGFPAGTPSGLAITAVGLGLALAAYSRQIGPQDAAVGLAATVAIPGLALVVRMPNTEQPRYFLCCATLIVIVAARALGRWWEHGGLRRVAAALLVAGSLIGQVNPIATLVTLGRGQTGALLATVGDTRPRTYATNIEFPVKTVLDYYAKREGVPALRPQDDPDEFCRNPPVWYIQDGAASLPMRLQVGPTNCHFPYTKLADLAVADLSGRHMVLFRRDRSEQAPQ